MSAGQTLLAACGLAPLLGALACLLLRRSPRTALAAATLAAGASALASLALLVTDPPWRRAADSVSLDLPWAGVLGSRLHLGWDGITAPLVVLSTALALLCVLYLAWTTDGRDEGADAPSPALLGCLLLVTAGAVATFTARDLIVFFVGFEAVLVPMWFVVARFGDTTARVGQRDGHRARDAAATRFVLYTVTGSAVLLVGLLVLATRADSTDLVVLARTAPQLDAPTQAAVALLLLVGLGVKVPVWPLHSWLPPAHTIAPTVGSVLLAGVLLKLGSYGLVRLVAGLVPDGLDRWAVPLAALGVVGILWGGLVCLVERDLKRLVAFSSVAHMGFVVVGVASGTPQGLQGALFGGVAHGVVTGLLFLLVGMLKHRTHTADLHALGAGLRDRAPRLGWVLALASAAGLGLPGLAGFWGELLAVVGAWTGGAALGGTARWVAALSALGTVLAAAYLLRVLYLVWHGPREPSLPALDDLHRREQLLVAPLALGSVALGVLPWLLLSVTGPAVRLLLGGGG